MATFFDVSVKTDAALLYSGVRKHSELSTVVDNVEREVLLKYQIRTGVNTYEIQLEGYNDTTPSNSHANLITALKNAIAKVTSHRLRFYDDKGVYVSETIGDYQYDRGAGAGVLDIDWPDGWSTELDAFFSEKPPWVHI